jgi:transposase-like protein
MVEEEEYMLECPRCGTDDVVNIGNGTRMNNLYYDTYQCADCKTKMQVTTKVVFVAPYPASIYSPIDINDDIPGHRG